ncbi:MAG: endo-1,4-beta-xylanase [Lachnospiraceae bacterium]|nr:endo-1,4-beta-xylanase [Lachnospiraceae bacterium]
MRKRLRRGFAGMLALLMVVTNFQMNDLKVNAEETTTEEKTYTMAEMGNPTMAWDVVAEDIADGGKKLSFAANYKSIFYAVPAELADADITQIKFNVKSVSGIEGAEVWWFGYKMYTEEGYTSDASGNGIGEGYSMYGNPTREVPADLETPIKYLAITSANEGITGPIDMEITGITFTVKKVVADDSVSDNNGSTGDDADDDAQITDGDYTYTMAEMGNSTMAWDVVAEDIADGGKKLTFAANYKSIFYAVPAELADVDITQIKFNVKSVSGIEGAEVWWFGYKMYTEEGYTSDASGNGIGEGYSMYGNPTREVPADLEAPIKYLAITSANEGITGPIDMEITGITFTVKAKEATEGGEGGTDTPVVPDTPAEDDGIYDFNELTKINSYGVTLTVDENGVLTADYADVYQESFYALPEDINPNKVQKVELLLAEGEGVTVKLYESADGTGDSECNYTTSMTPANPVGSFGIMNLVEGTNSVKITGVKFTIDTSADSDVPAEKNVVTYNFVDLGAPANSYGVNLTVGAGGELTADYQGQYQETFYNLPANIDSTKVKKIELVLSSGNNVCLKLYANAGGTGDSLSNYGVSYSPTAAFGSFGIMNLVNGTNTVKISGVKLTIEDALENVEINKTYTFNDLTVDNKAGISASMDSATGAVTYAYTGQYQEIFYSIPKEIDPAKVHKVTFNVSSDNAGAVAYKFYTEENYGGNWPSAPDSQLTYGNPVVELANGFEGIEHFGIMSLGTDAYNVVVDSVTFHTTGWGYSEGGSADGGENQEPDNLIGENIILNGNFADADVSMWKAAQGANSVISAETASEAIFGDVTTYGKISRDPATAGTGDCFQQDVTDRVVKGAEYYIEYYAMLSDEYANAPDNQKKVEFGPFFVLDGSNNYLGTAYSSELSGFNTQAAKVGEWTKYSGYITISCRGEEDKIVLRFIEQGTDYGSGDCVKGDYYITGVSMRQTDKPVPEIPEIEQDIPDWRDTIVGDLGAGTIAGTAVTYSEMRDETLWELVTKHFNAVTFGNELKLDAMIGNAKGQTEHVTFNGVDLEVPVLNHGTTTAMLDKILAWNTANPDKQIKVRGHVLVWHSQAPTWFFKENYDADAAYVSKEVMDLRLEWYIKTMMEYYVGPNSKYKDLFYGWDVVNEAINDSTATYRGADESNWAAVYGDKSNEYIIKAFRWANKYAPASLELYYNDYNDCVPSKVEGIVKLLNAVKAAEGTRIDGMGMQAHHNIDSPSVEQVDAAVRAYCAVVGKVQWTELDIKASSSYDGTDATREEEYNKMAYRYKAYYDVLKKLDAEDGIEVSGIIFWGTVDKYSWLQTSNSVGGSSSGGKQCPLLFDDNYKAKPAYWAFVDPSKLTPEVKDIIIAQKVDDEYTSGSEYSMEKGATKATVIPMWDNTGLKVVVKVQDATVDATDAVTVYVDPAMSAGATTPVKATVKRADAKAVSGGYEAEIAVALDSVGALKKVAMDVVVVNGTDKIAFNDTTLSQETSSKYYSIGLMKVGTTVESGTIVVDGEIDERWATVEEIPLSLGSVDADPTFKVLWDKDYLYVLADVKDTVLNKDHADAWMQDSIEVFIDENNKKTTGYDDDDKQYRINYANEQSFNGQKCKAENVISATKTVDGGYVIEAAFKWTDITPVNGSNVGFELQLNDAVSSSVRNKINWADDTDKGWSGSNVFGTITLVGAATLPELVEDLDKLVDENATLAEKTEAAKDIIAEVKGLVEAGRLDEVLEANVEEIEALFKESINRVLNIEKENTVPEIKAVIGAIIGMDLDKEAKMVFESVSAPSLDSKYKNAFALDIKLFADDAKVQPLVPVTIRMAVPASIDQSKKVVVLHYADGATTPEKLNASITGGFLEFTTTSFSTFVVANEVENQNAGSGSTSGSTTTSTPVTPSTPSTGTTTVVAPLTGDNAYPMVIFGIMMVMACVAVLIGKKKEEEK